MAAGTIAIGATLPGEAIATDEHGTGPEGTPNGQTKSLAVFASTLRYEDIPSALIQCAWARNHGYGSPPARAARYFRGFSIWQKLAQKTGTTACHARPHARVVSE